MNAQELNTSALRDGSATEMTRRRYQRIAPFYDLMEAMHEIRYKPWRETLWAQVRGPRVLEVGVGTGRNIPYYPGNLHVTAIDLTPAMLERARLLAKKLNREVDLRLGDVQSLDFPIGSFDTVVATCVFCSVPDPVLGLKEVRRVLKPGGQVLLLEHVRSKQSLIGRLMDFANPLVVRMIGANINRRTVENVRRSGLFVEQVDNLEAAGIFKLIAASRDPVQRI